MFIKSLQLKNFKRFTDLTIDLNNESSKELPKLVLLIGANGSGKSSVFDAFEAIQVLTKNSTLENHVVYWTGQFNQNYYLKNKQTDASVEIGFNDSLNLSKIFELQILKKENAFRIVNFLKVKMYGRTAFRDIEKFSSVGTVNTGNKSIDVVVQENLDNPEKFISGDYRIRQDVLYASGVLDNPDIENIRNEINSSLAEIFKSNQTSYFQLESMKRNVVTRNAIDLEISIRKNESIFDYENLSAGEKQLLNILFNLIVRRKFLSDSIVYLDEIDLHLHTDLQSRLLEVIVNKILPGDTQLWVASHSLGFIDYARKYDRGAIVDFDSLDFDLSQTLRPVNKSDQDKSYFKIALGENFLASILSEIEVKTDKVIVWTEGKNTVLLNKAKQFFAPDLPVIFYDGAGKNDLVLTFKQFQKNNHTKKNIFIFDCDAEVEYRDCLKTQTKTTIPIILPINEENNIIKKGIENMFPKYLFDAEYTDRNQYYTDSEITKIDDYGSQTQIIVNSFDKNKFMEFIGQKNDKTDFLNFEGVILQIQEILNS